MTDAPEQLLDMVRQAVQAHPNDIEDSLNYLVNVWGRCPARRTWAEELETRALRSMIHDCRHQLMVQMRRAHGAYGQAAKVGLSTGAANRIAEAMLLDSYSINGYILGNIPGEELESLARGEQAKAEGCAFNARLCSKLSSLVPKGKLVRDVVTEKKLRKLFQDLGQKDLAA